MTYKEAVEWQNAFRQMYNGMPAEVDDAIDLAVNALEKQIPVKPIVKGIVHEYCPPQRYCPICERRLKNNRHMRFCPRCGQAIDWSGGEWL